MVRFAEWLALESLMRDVRNDIFVDEAILESLDDILGCLVGGVFREQDEDDDGPVELDDPFSGSEDAEPVEIDSDYDPNAEEEREEAPKVPGGPSKRQKKALRRIRDALLIIRNDAKRRRAEKIEKMKAFKKELDGADLDDLDSKSPLDALGDLVDLGYLSGVQAEKIRDAMEDSTGDREKSERTLLGKIADAANETGNEHDPAMSMVSREGKEVSSPKQAMEELFLAMQDVYKSKFERIARDNMSRVGDNYGYVNHDASELASETFAYLNQRFTKRQWAGGKLMPWEENEGLLQSGDLAHLRNWIYSAIKGKISGRERSNRSTSLNPMSKERVKGVTSMDAKSSRINCDLGEGRSGNCVPDMSFYVNYMREAESKPLIGRKNPDADLITASSREDRVRLQIMKDIEYLVNYTRVLDTEISLDPGSAPDYQKLRRTLRTYKDNHLRRMRKDTVHASALAGNNDDESSSDELLSGADPRGFGNEDGGKLTGFSDNPMDRVAIDGGAPSMVWDPARGEYVATGDVQAGDAATPASAKMKGAIKRAIEDIAKSGAQGPSEAIALCLKLGVKFTFTSEPGRNGAKPKNVIVTDTSAMSTASATAATNDCAGKIARIGITPKAVSEIWPKGLWRPGYRSVTEYLRGNESSRGAVQKFCDFFRI